MSTRGRPPASVVVVGGGVMGAATALHLLEAGAGTVTVLDAGAARRATTPAGAGFVATWSAGYADFWGASGRAVQTYGIEFYRGLSRRGNDIGCGETGSLFLATTRDGWERFVAPMARHPLAPEGTRALDPGGVAEVTGAVSAAGVFGGVLHPTGLQIDTALATEAMLGLVEDLGGTVLRRQPADALLIDGVRVAGVRSAGRERAADVVVVACGAWTNALLAGTGWRVPLCPVVASRVTTPGFGVPPTMPSILIPELGMWLREKDGGYTYGGVSGYRALHELGAAAEDVAEPSFPALVDAMLADLPPRLAAVLPEARLDEPAAWIQGLPCYTPDRRFLAGPVPSVEGLYVVGGDNEAGVTHAPGLARTIAEIVCTGESRLVDPGTYGLDRFDPDAYASPADVAAVLPARWAGPAPVRG